MKLIKTILKFTLLGINVGISLFTVLMFYLIQTNGYVTFYEHIDLIRYSELTLSIIIVCANIYIILNALRFKNGN
jgi:hypothetical protein